MSSSPEPWQMSIWQSVSSTASRKPEAEVRQVVLREPNLVAVAVGHALSLAPQADAGNVLRLGRPGTRIGGEVGYGNRSAGSPDRDTMSGGVHPRPAHFAGTRPRVASGHDPI